MTKVTTPTTDHVSSSVGTKSGNSPEAFSECSSGLRPGTIYSRLIVNSLPTSAITISPCFGVTARHVCEVSGLSESALSRLKEEKLEQYSRALAAMGLVLNTPQAAGQPITWPGGFFFRVRFMADTADFENIIGHLWAAKKIEFVSVKL